MKKCDTIEEMKTKIDTGRGKIENIKESVGAKLAATRKKKGLNQQEVADIIGVSRSALSYWEKGERGIDIESLYKLCTVYDISIDYLVGVKSNPDTEFGYEEINELSSLGFSVEALGVMAGSPDAVQLFNDILLHPDFTKLEQLTHYSRYTRYEDIDCDYRSFLTSKILYSIMADIYKEWYIRNDTRIKELSAKEKKELSNTIITYLKKHAIAETVQNNRYDYYESMLDELGMLYEKLQKYL